MTSNFSRRTLLRASALTVLGGSLSTLEPSSLRAETDQPVDADLLLQGGTLYDGSGSEGLVGDVAIAGERIVAVGRFETGRVGRTIDCRGLIVAPGFIDLHSHSDHQILKPELRGNPCRLMDGCTTVVTGNCGVGQLDVAKFHAQLDENGAGTNIVHLMPHGRVRGAVMGTVDRRPTPDELDRMRRMIDEGMQAGAWGMSTGLIYLPGVYADTDELVELTKVVARHGGIYASHIRGEEDQLLTAVAEAIEIGRRAGAPVHISHFKANGLPNWGKIRDAAALIEKARADGQKVTADQYPYDACSTWILPILLPVDETPGGYENLLERMKADPELDQTVRNVIRRQLGRTRNVLIAQCEIETYRNRMIADIASAENRDQVEVVIDLIAAGKTRGINFSMSEDDVRYGMSLPWVGMGSDGEGVLAAPNGQGHPRAMGTFARKIGRYAIEERVISLAHAIRSASGLAADIMGLDDRGYLRPGYLADITVFDPATYRDQATYDNPLVYSTGVRHVLLAGNLALAEGTLNERLFGRALLRPTKRMGGGQ
ncbi:MAG: D-aminoacylase [Pirellulaceae bacterium]|nr:D-aminoacylase [Pirellulaceae bacterium]